MSILLISPLYLKNKRFIFLLLVGSIVTSIVLLIILQSFSSTSVSERIKHISSSKFDFDDLSFDFYTSDRIRYECWLIAWAKITQGDNKLLGIGPGNFKEIDITKLNYKKPPVYIYIFQVKLSHAHNIYLNKWVEEGIIGLLMFILFQLYIAYQLFIKNRPDSNCIRWEWLAAVGAFINPTIAGQFNSGLYGSIVWLSMMLFGYALGKGKGRGANPDFG